MEQGEEEVQTTQEWLHRFVKTLSEHSIRVFLACVANRLTLSTAGQTIIVEVCSQLQQPRLFPVASHMQLPACASYQVFASRMNAALRLGEYLMRTDAQHEQRLTREEERAVAQAMDGDIRPGGQYKCGCGYIYAIGECGGHMQQASCPGCGSNIGGASHRLEAIMCMLALMVLQRLRGLSDVLAGGVCIERSVFWTKCILGKVYLRSNLTEHKDNTVCGQARLC